MKGRFIFMLIGSIILSVILTLIEKIIEVDFGIIPFFIVGIIWGFNSDDFLEKIQKNGFLNFLK